MGARYLAAWSLATDPVEKTLRGALSSLGWSIMLQQPGLHVWVRKDRPLPVYEVADGVITIGPLYGRPKTLPPPAGLGAWLCREAWGSYAALLLRAGGPPHVLRDPSGARDAITWRRANLCLLADDIEGIPASLWPTELALDWDVVTDFIRRPVSAASRSALCGLTSIAPGDLAPMGGGASQAVWRPDQIVVHAPAADRLSCLRDTVASTVSAMARQAGPLMLETSGGLDSSIVANCLGTAAGDRGFEVRLAVNQFVADAEGDERSWARAVCDAARLPLSFIEKPIGQITEQHLTSLSGAMRPAMEALDPIRDQQYLELAKASGVQSLMTGQGGDAVFFQMPTALVVADLIAAEGLGAAFDTRALSVARWLRRSIWSVLYDAAAKTPLPGARAAARFWGPRAREAPEDIDHPWLDTLACAPGKRLQIRHIALCQLKFGRSWRGDELDVLHPLLAQPVVELCLSIPTWDLVHGGRDRGLARAAFAQRLPAAVAQRRSKGILARLYTQRVAASLDVLRPWLLDGLLAEAGVLDRGAVEQALTPEDLIWTGDGFRLFQVAMIEGWARHWQARESRSGQLDPAA